MSKSFCSCEMCPCVALFDGSCYDDYILNCQHHDREQYSHKYIMKEREKYSQFLIDNDLDIEG